MRVLAKLAFIPIAAVVIAFAVANRHALTLELWPLPFAVDLPVYLAVLGALVVGILIGGSAQWISDIKWRRRARRGDRRATALARELTVVQEKAAEAEAAAHEPTAGEPSDRGAEAALPAPKDGGRGRALLPRLRLRSPAR